MSETVGIIVVIIGVAVSIGGFMLLTRTRRQALGFLIMLLGFTFAGVGLLATDDTQVQERPPATREATPADTAAAT
jgi:hypothetical protein